MNYYDEPIPNLSVLPTSSRGAAGLEMQHSGRATTVSGTPEPNVTREPNGPVRRPPLHVVPVHLRPGRSGFLVGRALGTANAHKWPEERAMVRTVNSAYSVIEVWRRLVAAADFNVLRVERAALRRNDQAQEASRLVLKWEQEGEKREGPAYSIIGSSYEKVEATVADIIVILTALYQRADDIPATPLTRVSVHHAILQLGTGGFRLGYLEDTLCKQFTISIVRDPDDPTRVKPIVTYRIDRNKIKEAEKTVKYRKNTSVAHSTTLVPFPLLDSASLVIARAI
ncbi:hypothetical protein MYCTH_2130123 [Thermothelomyces thermophilus ATCC 42464]|uniref:Uncharacterized protein n=1 Tax=Thermothelomyces thermophilus (strain ATCC 42464 / BCRC 31852 / DSM 1799) TaxID=573729 RepID=G2QLZ4_THET4|nr:uncharacterized protein MYCTH_2130123 [Thermothelomyces thermophilus ATCC 42464]AEO60974.1 hypothetical protein MYCTH_2130123 [Thermothelomyces thermophilus ATCC 42464]